MKSLLLKFKANIPLILVLVVASLIALQNTSVNGYYSGWDNIHAEMNLTQYAYRVFYGSWEEHQGLGGPAAKGQLAEITRIPYLFILQEIFPEYLVRASFLFTMFLIGGGSMYFFVKNHWLEESDSRNKSMLAGLAGLIYLLHPLTLQQFYISFELFTIQFAFFPLVLSSIHYLTNKINKKSLIFFILMQLAIASSGHTPTVFYFGALFSIFYALAVYFKKYRNLFLAIKFSIFVGILTFITNSFWITPNLYYSFNNSKYVTESKANIVFGPEALWSIREASTLQSFLTGYHYLTTWKDYNFGTQKHELIFNEWESIFNNPFINFQLYVLSGFSILGFLVSLIQFKKHPNKSAIAILFFLTSAFIWIELFPTKGLLLQLYKSKIFLEIFRNPFTKLSILHSIFLVLLAVESFNFLIKLLRKKLSSKLANYLSVLLLSVIMIYTFSITPESIKGHFINEKLRVVFPPEYKQLNSFLESQNHSERILEMPYTSREGWVLYDWSKNGKINGYQGLGFYFFGFPQAFLTSDFARWSEVNDFFYEELGYAINSKDPKLLESVMTKYLVPLAIVDESRVQPYQIHNFDFDKELLIQAGFELIWSNNFITVFENQKIKNISTDVIAPNAITLISTNTERVSRDFIYSQYSDYVSTSSKKENNIQFPFISLQQSELRNTEINESKTKIQQNVEKQEYQVTIPGLSDFQIKTLVAIETSEQGLLFSFPQYSLVSDDETLQINSLPNFEVVIKNPISEIIINGTEVSLKENNITYKEIIINSQAKIVISDIEGKLLQEIDIPLEELTKEQIFTTKETKSISIISEFPNLKVDLSKQPSENCVTPKRGEIKTIFSNDGEATYTANEYGVNCNSVNIPFISPNSEYLTAINGENIDGRSIKLFVHYSMPNTTPIEYILPEKKFSATYTLKDLKMNPETKLFFNWESRSFGDFTKNTLYSFIVAPFSIDRLSQISLQPTSNISELESIQNNLSINSTKKHSISRYYVDLECESECYFGINQAYDDLWIAFDYSDNKILSHYRYNNWANIWQISKGKHKVSIIYLPQYMAFAGIGVLIIILILILIKKNNIEKTDLNFETTSKPKHIAKKAIFYRMFGNK